MTTEEIVSAWRQAKINLNGGSSLQYMQELETLLSFCFPESFKHTYLLVNGFKENDWTEGMFRVWSIEEIRQECAENLDRDFIPFCDYLINSHQIGFLRSKLGVFNSHDLTTAICLDFNEAMEMIILDSPEVN